MKLNVLTDYIAMNPEIKKIYIIGQDYSFGRWCRTRRLNLLREKRPDIEIVGNEFHPIGQVKDFTPYVTKIVSSDADAVITGNFGADMVSLARSIIDSGLDIPIYTFYAAYDGLPQRWARTASIKFIWCITMRGTRPQKSGWRIPEISSGSIRTMT